MSFTLTHPRQCETCPWRARSVVSDIPGYDPSLHEGLTSTISTHLFDQTSNMSCHYSGEGEDRYCIGWLANQLGPGNNIGLRLRFMSCTNAGDIELVGEQVDSFEETFE